MSIRILVAAEPVVPWMNEMAAVAGKADLCGRFAERLRSYHRNSKSAGLKQDIVIPLLQSIASAAPDFVGLAVAAAVEALDRAARRLGLIFALSQLIAPVQSSSA